MKQIDYPITITVHVDAEAKDAPYVAYIPEFDVSSFGKTEQKAVKNAKEALHITLDEIKKEGNLDQFLENLGISKKDNTFIFPKVIVEQFRFSV